MAESNSKSSLTPVVVGALLAGISGLIVARYSHSLNAQDKPSEPMTTHNDVPVLPSPEPQSSVILPQKEPDARTEPAKPVETRPTVAENLCGMTGQWLLKTFHPMGQPDADFPARFTGNAFIADYTNPMNGTAAKMVSTCTYDGHSFTLGTGSIQAYGQVIPVAPFAGRYEKQSDGSFLATNEMGERLILVRTE